ncbi:PTS transporter subunit EIIC, partial [Clostridium perfringens]|uniref:PTS transporter subunit EIIC n=1 Tax=Clostridium perfringens TaxID=1502 RepID=UPI002ACC0842
MQKGSVEDSKAESKFKFSDVFDIISGIFVPIVPAIAGCGLLKAFLALSTTLGILSKDSQTYYIMNFVADTAFYFLPILLAYTAAIKFKCSPYIAMVLGGVLLHPSFSALVAVGDPVKLFGLPVTLAKYGSSVVPI